MASVAFAINERGDAVGWSDLPSGGTHAVRWSKGAILDLGIPGTVSKAYAVNNRGQIVGETNFGRAFLWEEGLTTDLGALPGASRSVALGINDKGTIVGASHTAGSTAYHAVIWSP